MCQHCASHYQYENGGMHIIDTISYIGMIMFKDYGLNEKSKEFSK